MKIAVVHTLLEEIGGAERLMVDLVKALRDMGLDVDVYARFESSELLNRIGLTEAKNLKCRNFKELTARLLKKTGRFVRLARLLTYWACLEDIANLRTEYDLVFETQSRLLMPVDASYIHYPARLDIALSGKKVLPYELAVRYILNKIENPPRLILTNSTWTKRKVFEAYGNVPVEVLYPPVRLDFFGTAQKEPFTEREKIVVTVSRFTPEKKLEEIPRVARELPDYEFYIVGNTSKHSEAVIRRIRSVMTELKVSNVTLLTNAPDDSLRDLLAKARFYLHPPYAEHFGIAIAEAMAAGTIPIVYKDGGGWVDLVSPVDPMLGYEDLNQVPQIVRTLEQNSNRAEEIRRRAYSHVRRFSFENFKNKLARIVAELSSKK